MFPDLHPGYYKLHHQRASSAPCTPFLDPRSSSLTSPSTSPPSPSSHHPHKNVHFPSQEQGGLATICVFNRSARPASLSRLGEETETETEGEGSTSSGKYVQGSTYPFPRVGTPSGPEKSPLNPFSSKRIPYEIDWSQSSSIPRKNLDLANENVFIQSVQFVPDLGLHGSIVVRNITYQKTVMVRYTIDEWETVNDVLAWYDVNKDGDGWDRFKFSISLGEQGLENRVVWLVAKFAGDSVGAVGEEVEWWDNNKGRNYKVGFKKVEEKEKPYKRGVVVSAPPTYISPTPTTPTSTLTRPTLSPPQISFPWFPQQQDKERQAALTQSTLARLKKLDLKNYAAPRGYGFGQNSTPSPVLTVTSATPTTSSFTVNTTTTPNLSLNTEMEMSSSTLSTPSTDTTSVDSTPVQTPTQDDDDDNERGWRLGMENGHFATTLMPATLKASGISLSPSSTPTPTIPISSPSAIAMDVKKKPKTVVEMSTSPPFSDLEESVVRRGGGGGGGSVYWDWGSVGAVVALGSAEGKERRKESSGMYQSLSMTTTSGGGLTPPQRKRGLQQQQRGNGVSSSGSGSGSDSKSPLPSSSGSTPVVVPPSSSSLTPTQTAISAAVSSSTLSSSVPLKQKPTPPKLNLATTRTTTPVLAGVQPPYPGSPRRGLGDQQQRYGHRVYQPMPSSLSTLPNAPPSKSPPIPPSASSSDAIYQALVREWCFAQGPGPVVGGISNNATSAVLGSGESTPVVVVGSPLSEGE